MNSFGKRTTSIILTALAATTTMIGGCDAGNWFGGSDTVPLTSPPNEHQYAQIDVPQPINLLLPKSINIHPFTVTRTFDDAGGIRGIDVRVEAFNAFHEATKAFGSFRFELHTHQAPAPTAKGELREIWEIEPSLLDPKENMRYWNRSQQMYEFKLQWTKPIPVGQKFVLTAVFTSPFTERLTTRRIFISGQ